MEGPKRKVDAVLESGAGDNSSAECLNNRRPTMSLSGLAAPNADNGTKNWMGRPFAAGWGLFFFPMRVQARF